jgi:hypothetical protein
VVAVALTACTGDGDESVGLSALAGAACRHARECSCPEPESFGDTEPACEDIVLERLPRLENIQFLFAEDAPPPTFDTRCLELAVDIVLEAECDADFSSFWAELPCALYRGTANVGDACESVPPPLHWCLEGLACVAGRCEPSHVAETSSGLPGPGEPCTENAECDETAWCESGPDEALCRALAEVGDLCMGHPECQTRYCPAGKCDELPTEGELCGANTLCADGLDCDGERCVARPASCVP